MFLIKLIKMKTKINPLKISFAIALIGILLLLFIANSINPKLTYVQDINNKLLNKKITVKGQIFNIKTYQESNFQIISIKDSTGEIDVVLNNPINITKNQNVIIIGKVTEYNNTLQIQADKIILS